MQLFHVDLFVSVAPVSGVGPGHVYRGQCRLDAHQLTITLHLPDGTTITRRHDRLAPLPVILDSLDLDPSPHGNGISMNTTTPCGRKA